MKAIVCHAGSASDPDDQDGPKSACEVGFNFLNQKQGALEAVIAAVEYLENDERFNAGTGSNLRLDGKTIQMDAACMSSKGTFGATAAIERVKNPIRVAQCVMATPHILLVGDGARAFARRCGHKDHDPTTKKARKDFEKIQATLEIVGEWSPVALKKAWNYDTPIHLALGSDTVGAVAFDGHTFAAGLSSGGLTSVLNGRVGDSPLPGCGLYAGAAGAVAITGDGEHIARSLLAYRSYLHLEHSTLSPKELIHWTLNQLPEDIDIGMIIVSKKGFAGGARHNMAWYGTGHETEGTP